MRTAPRYLLAGGGRNPSPAGTRPAPSPLGEGWSSKISTPHPPAQGRHPLPAGEGWDHLGAHTRVKWPSPRGEGGRRRRSGEGSLPSGASSARLFHGFSSRMLINLWMLVMFRTAEWSVSPSVDESRDRRTAPRYLLTGGASNPSRACGP